MSRLNLGEYLKEHGISAYRLAKEGGGKVPSSTVYSMARSPKRRSNLATVSELLKGLEQFSELQHEENRTPHASILCFAALQVRPARQNSLALLWSFTSLLGQKATPFLTNALKRLTGKEVRISDLLVGLPTSGGES